MIVVHVAAPIDRSGLFPIALMSCVGVSNGSRDSVVWHLVHPRQLTCSDGITHFPSRDIAVNSIKMILSQQAIFATNKSFLIVNVFHSISSHNKTFECVSGPMRKNASLYEIDALCTDQTFTKEDLRTVYDRFSKLDIDGDGIVNPTDFRSNPGLASNPLLDRLINALDKDGDGGVSFFEFCSGLALFAGSAPKDAKLDFLFKVFDGDNDGFLTEDDLLGCTKLISEDTLTDDQIRDLARQQIACGDRDSDGKLSLDEFKQVMGRAALDETFM